MLCLVMVKADWVYELFELLDREPFQAFGRVATCGKKPLHRIGSAGILGPGGKNGSDQDAEWVVGLCLDEFDDGCGVSFELFFQCSVNSGDILGGHVE